MHISLEYTYLILFVAVYATVLLFSVLYTWKLDQKEILRVRQETLGSSTLPLQASFDAHAPENMHFGLIMQKHEFLMNYMKGTYTLAFQEDC